MYDIMQFFPFINLVASYRVFHIPFNTCAAGRQRFGENCHMLPSVKVVSKLSQRSLKVVSKKSQNCVEEVSKLCRNFVKSCSEMSQSCDKWSLLMLPCCHEIFRGSVFNLAVVARIPLNIFLLLHFITLGPMLPSGSLGQDTVWADTFWRKTMKNQPGTMKNHEKPT